MERIQESRLTILERWHSPFERRIELTFGSIESPVQHVGRQRRFAYQSHRKRTSRVAIPYRRRRFRHHHTPSHTTMYHDTTIVLEHSFRYRQLIYYSLVTPSQPSYLYIDFAICKWTWICIACSFYFLLFVAVQ
jgi:hypothetical protein